MATCTCTRCEDRGTVQVTCGGAVTLMGCSPKRCWGHTRFCPDCMGWDGLREMERWWEADASDHPIYQFELDEGFLWGRSLDKFSRYPSTQWGTGVEALTPVQIKLVEHAQGAWKFEWATCAPRAIFPTARGFCFVDAWHERQDATSLVDAARGIVASPEKL